MLLALLALARGALAADDSTAVDLFAGWSYMPYPYCWHPGYGYSPFWGVGVPLCGPPYAARSPYFADYFDPYWGYDYGVRYRIWPNRPHLRGPGGDAPYVPGAAPTEPRASERKTEWDREIERFLKAPLPMGPAATNAIPRTPAKD